MYLGIDLGTSAIKALIIDDRQNVIASVTRPLEVSRPHPGWCEQDPSDWIGACEDVLEALRHDHASALSAVRGIGLSGQMHGATLLGDDDAVLRPAILWNDTRAQAEAIALDQRPEFRQISGNIVFAGFTAPKLVWVENNEPDIHRRVSCVLLPKDFLRLWLTGERVSEMSDAAGTSWLDTGKRQWSDVLLTAGGMDRAQMPRLVEGTQGSGTLRRELAQRWGLGGSVTVAGGGGDNAASAIGIGAVASGSAFVSLGTSGVLFAATGEYRPNAKSAVHTFCHALPDTWHQMGVILSASDSLSWFAEIVGRTPEALTGELGHALRPPGEALFLPYLCGERTPHNDAAIRGAFGGLGREADRGALTHAILTGVAFALKDNLAALGEAGTTLSSAVALGGGSRSRYWLKLISTVLGIAIEVPEDGDFGAAFGAARLGLIAAEACEPGDICKPPPIAETIEPELALAPDYEAAWQQYRAFYPAVKGALT